ncbi:hypothetical protein NX059_011003 [Plenodomus lindquistii]|nr:hypothetical protein NX059_011003 [Plenodomus lindquistii]
MGLPYSRQINAAFEQVTPLVAAGFKVLRTTRDISILLAVIQVLTVWLLFLILVGIVGVLVCVNPDLEEERKLLITPWLKLIMRITLWSLIKTAVSFTVCVGAAAWVVWRGIMAKRWVEDVEYEGNVDADKALEDLDGERDDGNEEETKEKNGKGGKKK